MGLGRHGTNSRYISVANGKLNTVVNGNKESFDWYEGTLVGIRLIEDEWEGQPVAKVELLMADESGEKVKIKFTQETWFSVGFFSRIQAVDLARPFRLGAMPSEQNEKITFCFMRQGDKIPSDKSTPRPEKVKVGKKTVMDWQGFNAFVEQVIGEIGAKAGPTDSYPTDEDYNPPDDDLGF